jgi:hypothetical protein
MQRILRGALASLLLYAAPLCAEPVVLTQTQAKRVAQQAYAAGNPALANALAKRLTEAAPGDAEALLLLAATETALGRPEAGRKAGRLGFARSDDPGLRHEIARHTAFAAYNEGRPGLARFWLRRASDTAPDTDAYERDGADFRALRAQSPFRFGFDLSVAPSSNLNNGAQGGFLTVGSVTVGALSGSAQALSGTRIVTQAQLGYSLPDRPRARTTLLGRIYASQNILADEAKARVRDPVTGEPTLTGSDLNQTSAEVIVRHHFTPAAMRNPLSASLATGQSWAGGQQLGPHLRAEFGMPLLAGPQGSLRLAATVERQWQDAGPVTAQSLALEGERRDARGNAFGWGVTLRQTSGDTRNQDNREISGELNYSLGRPVGPVMLSGRLTGLARDYEHYSLGPFLQVTDGRSDYQITIALDMTLSKISLMGYAPRISLTGQQTQSNISRFDTQQLGVAFGFTSHF